MAWKGEGRTHLGHATVDNKVRAVYEAAFVAGEEEDGVGLFDGFAEAAGWKMYLAAVALGCVVAEPVLKEGGAAYGRHWSVPRCAKLQRVGSRR